MRTWVLAGGAALLGVAFAVVLWLPLDSQLLGVLSNVGQELAAIAATVGCAVAARHELGRRRAAWWWLCAGTAAWAAGQVVYGWYALVEDRETPFPSLADLGFVPFPLLAAVGLVIWLGTQGDGLLARGRDVLDGAIIAGSLLLLSWVTTLGTVADGGADDVTAMALSLAYPVGDVILATLILLALARGARHERATLGVLAAGFTWLAVADSAYVYLTGTGRYSSADVVSSGWTLGFLLVGAAGLSVRTATEPVPRPDSTVPLDVRRRGSLLRFTLPYVPLLAGGTALGVALFRMPSAPTVSLVLGIALVTVVISRQLLALRENQRLLLELADARDALEHQALHDALTGLANRVLFADRLDRALLQPTSSVSVLFCVLDDFKVVNDAHGHPVGDLVLQEVAARLLTCVRATDTVARLGGDEFAILLEGSEDAVAVGDRVVAALREPMTVAGHEVRSSVSVGIARHEAERAPAEDRRGEEFRPHRPVLVDGQVSSEALLRYADTAMYAAKKAGKARAVLAEDG